MRYFNISFIPKRQRGKGYNPYFLTTEEQNYLDDYSLVKDYYDQFNQGAFKEIEPTLTKAELNAHIVKKELNGISIEALLEKIQRIPKRKTNIFRYLFSSKKEKLRPALTLATESRIEISFKRGGLYSRLIGIKRFIDKPPRKRRESFIGLDKLFQNKKGKKLSAYYEKDPLKERTQKETMKEVRLKIINKLPSEKHKIVFERHFLDKNKQIETAKILNVSKGRVSQIKKETETLIKKSSPMKDTYRDYCQIMGYI